MNGIEILNELTEESLEVLKELIEEEIKPLVKYRADLEKKIGNKEISDMYRLEEEI